MVVQKTGQKGCQFELSLRYCEISSPSDEMGRSVNNNYHHVYYCNSSVIGCSVSNILCEYKIMFGIMNGNNVCALMNKSNIKSNNIGIVKWKCNIKAKQPESGDLCGNITEFWVAEGSQTQ